MCSLERSLMSIQLVGLGNLCTSLFKKTAYYFQITKQLHNYMILS